LDNDAMSPLPHCHVLYALLIASLVSSLGHAAAIAQPGGQGAQASDSSQKRDPAPGAANARRDPATWGEPLKGAETANRAAGPRAAAAPEGLGSSAQHDARFGTPHRFSPQRAVIGNIAKPAIPAAGANPLRRSNAEHLISRFDPVTAGGRGFGSTNAGATGHQSSPSFAAASRSNASLKPLAAGNGVIGGPHASGRGMIGGPGNGNNVLKASIDGTALRRRF
jgi:hypothetical protein